MMENSKENPAPLGALISLLGLPPIPKIKRGFMRLPYTERIKLRNTKNAAIKQRKDVLKKYRAGKYKDYEGDGYYMRNVYLYNGKYYG